MADLIAGARVLPDDVRDVIETVLVDAELNACINTANLLIGSKPRMLTDLSSDVLTQIELWLAAHFVSVREPRIVEETIDNTRLRYEQPKASGLIASSYGQVAIALDTTLSLSETAPATRRATLHAL